MMNRTTQRIVIAIIAAILVITMVLSLIAPALSV